MNENIKSRNLLITALFCLLVIVCFTFFRKDNSKNKEEAPFPQNESVEIYRAQISTEADASEITIPVNYTISLKDNNLNFYLNSHKETLLLESIPINVELFPDEDIKSLSKGLTVNSLEEGINIIEDFTS